MAVPPFPKKWWRTLDGQGIRSFELLYGDSLRLAREVRCGVRHNDGANARRGVEPMRADARRNYEKIIAAAREVFAERGAEGLLDEIAKRAGCSDQARSIAHFLTREDLIDALMRDWSDRVLADSKRQPTRTSRPGDARTLVRRIRYTPDPPPWRGSQDQRGDGRSVLTDLPQVPNLGGRQRRVLDYVSDTPTLALRGRVAPCHASGQRRGDRRGRLRDHARRGRPDARHRGRRHPGRSPATS